MLVELLVVVLVLGDLLEELHALLDDVLADDLQDLALLEHLTRDVEGQILGVDNTLDEVKVVGDQVFAVVHDEHTAHVELDVVLLFLVLEHVEGCALGYKQQGTELKLALDGEVLNGQVVLPVVGETLVELSVFLLGDIVWVTGPDGLHLVQLFLLSVLFFDGLLLCFLVLIFILILVFIQVLDLRLVLILLKYTS